MTERRLIESSLNELPRPVLFKDYRRNGLQIGRRAERRRRVCGVTASQACITAERAGGASIAQPLGLANPFIEVDPPAC